MFNFAPSTSSFFITNYSFPKFLLVILSKIPTVNFPPFVINHIQVGLQHCLEYESSRNQDFVEILRNIVQNFHLDPSPIFLSISGQDKSRYSGIFGDISLIFTEILTKCDLPIKLIQKLVSIAPTVDHVLATITTLITEDELLVHNIPKQEILNHVSDEIKERLKMEPLGRLVYHWSRLDYKMR